MLLTAPSFVSTQVMCAVEKEMRALHNTAFDKTTLSETEKLRMYGGVLTSPKVIDCMRHEARWDRNSKYPRRVAAPSEPSGAGISSGPVVEEDALR